jgi:multiple sugar transport system ATP-binding protein
MTMGDRVAVLNAGVLQQVDGPRTLYDKPANAFVAAFIGSPSMNLVEVPIVEGGVRLGGTVVPVPRETLAKVGSDKTVILGVRPEDLHVAPDGVPVDVTLVEELGADTYVYGNVTHQDGSTMMIVAREAGNAGTKIGDKVKVMPQDVHVFRASGEQERISA